MRGLRPCLHFSREVGMEQPSLHTSAELGEGRDQEHLTSEGSKVGRKRGQGEAQGGRRRGRKAGRSVWERCQQCYKHRVLSNTICPEIKGSETETQRPIRRQWRRQWQPGRAARMELLQ